MLQSDLEKFDVAVQTSISSLDDSSRTEVEEELAKLREDKSLLEGKIRGYLTLSDICQEYKDELTRLREEYEKLLTKVKQPEMKSQPQRLSSASPTPDNDLGPDKGHDLDQRHSHKHNIMHSQIDEKTDTNKTQTEHVNIYQEQRPIQATELFDAGPKHSKSSEGSKSIPEVMSNNSIEETNDKHLFGPGLDKYPMQESLALSSHSHLNQESLTGLGFEHLSDQMPLGESAGTFQPGTDDLMYFASVTQGQESGNTAKKKPEEAEINEVITSLPLQTDETNKVVQTISKVLGQKDQQIKKLTHMNSVLIEKNSQLQREKKELDKDRQRILDKVQTLEKEVYDLSRSQSPQDGWVKVDKVTQNEVQKASVENIRDPIDSLSEVREQNRQLRDANQKWSQEWDKLRKHFETRISHLQSERDRVAKEITELKIKEEVKDRDFEKMIMNAKKKAGDEESAKEEVLLQLTAANNRADSLSSQLTKLQDEMTRLRREKQTIETELNVVRRQGPVGEGSRAVETPLGSSADNSITELKNENMVLRHQILVFQEDFDRERQDRATAQSIKDDLKKQNETLKKRARQVEVKNVGLERQLKASEDSGRKLLTDKEKLQQELCDVKTQLQHERENHAISQYTQQPVVQSAGFYQAPPQPQPQPMRMFGQLVMPQQQQQHTVAVPPGYQYQNRVEDYTRPVTTYVPASQPQIQQRNPIYPTNQPGQVTEMLVGAWSCSQCTYKNYPGRTVCEICGYIQSPTTRQPQYRPTSGPLTPRGDQQQQQQQGYGAYNMVGTQNPNDKTGT